jgi:hypothetical protein
VILTCKAATGEAAGEVCPKSYIISFCFFLFFSVFISVQDPKSYHLNNARGLFRLTLYLIPQMQGISLVSCNLDCFLFFLSNLGEGGGGVVI